MMMGAGFGEMLAAACDETSHTLPYFVDADDEAPVTLRSPSFEEAERDVAA